MTYQELKKAFSCLNDELKTKPCLIRTPIGTWTKGHFTFKNALGERGIFIKNGYEYLELVYRDKTTVFQQPTLEMEYQAAMFYCASVALLPVEKEIPLEFPPYCKN